MNQLINKIKKNKIMLICLFIYIYTAFATQNSIKAYDVQNITTYNTPYRIQTNNNSRTKLNAKATKKSIKNLAVFVKFSDSNTNVMNHLDDEQCVENAEKIFNSEYFEMDTVKGKILVPSFKKYYEMQSYGNLSIETEIFPKKDGKVVTYEDKNPIGYYLRYSDKNPIGYKNESYVNENKFSNDCLVKFSGIYVDDDGDEIEVSREIKLNVSWKDEREVKVETAVEKYKIGRAHV